jgi:Ca2+-binding EF-hand superfamily protein
MAKAVARGADNGPPSASGPVATTVGANTTLYARVFEHHARNGQVPSAQLATLVRCCGFAPTDAELDALRKKVGGRQSLNEGEFLALVTGSGLQSQTAKAEIVDALYGFNKLRGVDSDFVSKSDLKTALMRVGAGPLAAKEFEDVLKAIQDHKVETNSRGDISIAGFVEKVLLIL